MDPRRLNIPNCYDYKFPHEAEASPWNYSHPVDYDKKNLYTNFVGSRPQTEIVNLLDVPHGVLLDDVAHEFDYES